MDTLVGGLSHSKLHQILGGSSHLSPLDLGLWELWECDPFQMPNSMANVNGGKTNTCKSWDHHDFHDISWNLFLFNCQTSWWFETYYLIFNLSWGDDSILPNLFQMGWNHQLVDDWHVFWVFFRGSFGCWTACPIAMWRARSIECVFSWKFETAKFGTLVLMGQGLGIDYDFEHIHPHGLWEEELYTNSFWGKYIYEEFCHLCVLGGSLLPRHVVSYLTSLNEFLSFHCET